MAQLPPIHLPSCSYSHNLKQHDRLFKIFFIKLLFERKVEQLQFQCNRSKILKIRRNCNNNSHLLLRLAIGAFSESQFTTLWQHMKCPRLRTISRALPLASELASTAGESLLVSTTTTVTTTTTMTTVTVVAGTLPCWSGNLNLGDSS